MGKFTITHEINCDVATFWKLFFDKEFNNELFLQVLGFPEYQTLDQQETETAITRKVSGRPKMNMPGPVEKLLGANFRYTEEGKLDRAKGLWTWKMTAPIVAAVAAVPSSADVDAPAPLREPVSAPSAATLHGAVGVVSAGPIAVARSSASPLPSMQSPRTTPPPLSASRRTPPPVIAEDLSTPLPPPLPPPSLSEFVPPNDYESGGLSDDQFPGSDDHVAGLPQPSSNFEPTVVATSPHSATDPDVSFYQVFQEYVQARERCRESVEGLSYDLFRKRLADSRATIIRDHGCHSVEFHVYIKDGKAALRAVPQWV